MPGEIERVPERPPYPQSYEAEASRAFGQLELREVIRVMRARKLVILAVFAVIVFGSAVATFTMRPVYQADVKLLVEGEQRSSTTAAMEEVISTYTGAARSRSVETQAVILREPAMLLQALKNAHIPRSQTRGLKWEIEPITDTDAISITVRSPNKDVAKRFADSLVKTYLAFTLRTSRQAFTAGAEFVSDQLTKVKAQLTRAEQRLKDFKEQYGAVALDSQTQALMQQVAAMEGGYRDAIADASSASSRAQRLRQQLGQTSQTVVSSERVSTNPLVVALQTQIQSLEVERAGLLKQYQPASSKVTDLDARIAQARKDLKDQMGMVLTDRQTARNPHYDAMVSQIADLEGQAMAANARAQALQRSLSEQRARVSSLPRKELELAQLTRDVTSLAQTYDMLTSREQELNISKSVRVPAASPVDQAYLNPRPVSPKTALNLTLACVLGLFLGLAVAFTQEYLDDTVKSTDDVQHHLGMPVLGHIALLKSPRLPLVHQLGSRSPLTEGYRILRSNIAFTELDSKRRTVLVTSTGPGEGKSITAVNLATVMAQQGKSVILADTDLRRPAIHHYLNLPNQVGLSNVLIGTATLDQALQQTTVKGLRVLTSGPLPPNPADLLSSDRATRMIEGLKERADIIVFDSPPAVVVTDAQILSTKVDGVLVVAASHQVARKALARARELLEHARAPIIGAVLNKIDIARDRYYDDYYYYYSHYYYYGQDSGDGDTVRGAITEDGPIEQPATNA